jgi:hypothetical protein
MIRSDGTGKGVKAVDLSVTNDTNNVAIANINSDGDLTLSAGDSGDLKLSSRGTTYTLPTTDGSANDVLVTNGSGITSWSTLADAGGATAATPFAIDNVMIRSDGTGNGIQATGISINDSNEISGITSLSTGNLLVGSNSISNASGNITITPNGNFRVSVGGTTYNWPSTDGTSGQLLQTDGAGTLSFVDINLDNYIRTEVNVSSYTILDTDYIIGVLYSNTGVCTLTLPQISSITGNKKLYTIVDEGGNAAANNITITTTGGDTIIGGSILVINGNYNSINIYSDGVSGWFVR